MTAPDVDIGSKQVNFVTTVKDVMCNLFSSKKKSDAAKAVQDKYLEVNIPFVDNSNTNASLQGSDGQQIRNRTADGVARRDKKDHSDGSLQLAQGNVIKESAFEYIKSEKSKNNNDFILASSDASTTYQRDHLKKKQRLFSHSNAKSYTRFLDNEFIKGAKVIKKNQFF